MDMIDLRRSLRKYPALRDLRRRLRILRATGRWRPDHIKLAASGRVIHVDPSEPRGWKIIRGLGVGNQPSVIAMWIRAIEVLDPTVAIDVGVNYGEILLSGDYRGCRAVMAIEANPTLRPIIERSLAVHPDRSRITLHQILASDEDGGTATLRIDPAWSGTASTTLTEGRGAQKLLSHVVPTRTLDALCPPAGSPDRLLFKIDAEGWEPQVLRGMSRLLTTAEEVVGLVEFEPGLLAQAGSEPDEVFEQFGRIGVLWSIRGDGSLERCVAAPATATDLLITSDPRRGETMAKLGATR